MKKKLISMAAICLCLMNLTGCDGKALSEAGLNTLMGMGIVFLVLIFISFIIWLMGFIPKMMSGEKKTAPAPAKPAAPVPTVAPTLVEEEPEELSDDLELVAVITAAIMASMGEEAPEDGLVVRSIRKRTAANWKNA